MATLSSTPFHVCKDEHGLPEQAATRRKVTWQEWQGIRNRVLAALRPLGTVGEVGDTPLDAPSEEAAFHAAVVEEEDPVYYVPDHQENQSALFFEVEVRSTSAISLLVLEALWGVVEKHRECGVSIYTPNVRLYYLDAHGVWFLDATRPPVKTLADALALPVVTAPKA
ncbi:MAG: hypothetical protein ABJD11_11240 [Gemmatimonadota bacterium]